MSRTVFQVAKSLPPAKARLAQQTAGCTTELCAPVGWQVSAVTSICTGSEPAGRHVCSLAARMSITRKLHATTTGLLASWGLASDCNMQDLDEHMRCTLGYCVHIWH
eukprot:gnl/TRDRNA2_/TRDRNA2_174916_c0_seq1.p1 gnl/TRDRNA2_/TRDRNA2_174916_c0~~gnl/TRDRNA2_/TRDRNA2_174916_c0_seq1.p1  ORF type:complete len:107 (+),score=6.34 gnl/TRDRNA2_/TRDRNA2_174916_c0_seq1:365-685(+)